MEAVAGRNNGSVGEGTSKMRIEYGLCWGGSYERVKGYGGRNGSGGIDI